MECNAARGLFSRKIDGELTDAEKSALDAHLAQCPYCLRAYRILSLPHNMAKIVPAPIVSPYFYQRLEAAIAGQAQNSAFWQLLFTLSRKIIPAFAGITLALLSIFAYLQMRSPEVELYRAYEKIFLTEEQPYQLLLTERGSITDEQVLRAIAQSRGDFGFNSKTR